MYIDGSFTVYEIWNDPEKDYPLTELRLKSNPVAFTELQVFDRTKNDYKTNGIEVTKKIRTRPRRMAENQFLKIDNQFYKVENAVTAVNSSGFMETDITLSKYTESYIVNEVAT